MKKSDRSRVRNLFRYYAENPGTTISDTELARLQGVTTRTIRRDNKALRDLGVIFTKNWKYPTNNGWTNLRQTFLTEQGKQTWEN